MSKIKSKLLYTVLILILAALVVMNYIQVPYFVHKPGTCEPLEPMIKVTNGYKDKGTLRLVTIYEIKANLFQYLLAKYDFNKYTTVLKANLVELPDETSQELEVRNLDYMKNATDTATYVAYKAAHKNPVIEHIGVKVIDVNSKMPVSKVLKPADIIIGADGKPVHTIQDLQSIVKGGKNGQTVQLKVERGKTTQTVSTQLAPFPKEWTGKDTKKIGLGIIESDDINVKVKPSVSFNTQGIGGPSAGLMMTLETFNQLTPTDYTKGYNIAGTGTMDFNGNVGPIGGIKQKIVAANRVGADIFFAPEADHEAKDAEAAVKDIHSKIKVVPVKTFDDAINYLKGLKVKQASK